MSLFLKSFPFCLFCFLRLENLIGVIFPSFVSVFPTALLALAPMLRPGYNFASFFVHLVFGCEAILNANLHFIFLCVLMQQGILAALIFSSASFVLLFYVLDPIFGMGRDLRSLISVHHRVVSSQFGGPSSRNFWSSGHAHLRTLDLQNPEKRSQSFSALAGHVRVVPRTPADRHRRERLSDKPGNPGQRTMPSQFGAAHTMKRDVLPLSTVSWPARPRVVRAA